MALAEPDNCAVCLEPLDGEQIETRLARCGHKLHEECWRGWRSAIGAGVHCPLCRHVQQDKPRKRSARPAPARSSAHTLSSEEFARTEFARSYGLAAPASVNCTPEPLARRQYHWRGELSACGFALLMLLVLNFVVLTLATASLFVDCGGVSCLARYTSWKTAQDVLVGWTIFAVASTLGVVFEYCGH